MAHILEARRSMRRLVIDAMKKEFLTLEEIVAKWDHKAKKMKFLRNNINWTDSTGPTEEQVLEGYLHFELHYRHQPDIADYRRYTMPESPHFCVIPGLWSSPNQWVAQIQMGKKYFEEIGLHWTEENEAVYGENNVPYNLWTIFGIDWQLGEEAIYWDDKEHLYIALSVHQEIHYHYGIAYEQAVGALEEVRNFLDGEDTLPERLILKKRRRAERRFQWAHKKIRTYKNKLLSRVIRFWYDDDVSRPRWDEEHSRWMWPEQPWIYELHCVHQQRMNAA